VGAINREPGVGELKRTGFYNVAIASTFSSSDTSRYRYSTAIDTLQVLNRLQPCPRLIQGLLNRVLLDGLKNTPGVVVPGDKRC
jgi:hypothetical protein